MTNAELEFMHYNVPISDMVCVSVILAGLCMAGKPDPTEAVKLFDELSRAMVAHLEYGITDGAQTKPEP